jgi:hypothetical protein
MRYFVRNPNGEEVVVPTLGDLHALYSQGFVADEDLVRAETSDRWVRAGAMPALHGVRLRRTDPRKLWLLVLAAAVLAAGVALLVAR